MVVLCRIAKISLFFPFYATEKNFLLKPQDCYFVTIIKCPEKRWKQRLLDFILSGKTEFQQDQRSCLKFRIPCIYTFICEESPSNNFSRSSCRTCSRISSSRFFAFRRLVKDSRSNSSQRGNCRGASIWKRFGYGVGWIAVQKKKRNFDRGQIPAFKIPLPLQHFFAFFMIYILDNAIRGWYSSCACE